MANMLSRNLGLPVLIGLLFSACTSGAAENSTTTTSTVPPGVQALPYFEELAKESRVGFDAAMAMSVGPAREYALYRNEYLQAITFAESDGTNFKSAPLQTARLDDSGRIFIESTDERIMFSDFLFANGKILDFKVEGRALSGNIKSQNSVYQCFTGGGGCDSDESMDLNILHSYIGSTGNLNVTYSIRRGSRGAKVREDRTGNGLPNHEVRDSSGRSIGTTFGIETFAIGETRTNVVQFGPLTGGGEYVATFRFRSNGFLYEFEDILLGNFSG